MGNALPTITLTKEEAREFDVFAYVKAELLQKKFKIKKCSLVARVAGKTYLYLVHIDGRPYALKISYEVNAEIEMTKQIPQTDYTVPCHAAGKLTRKYKEFTYLLLDWIPGGDLQGQVLSKDEALDVLWCCCKALAAMHGSELIHRDIKPGNILKRADGHYVLADYGISRKKDNKLLTANQGTQSFMAPEVISDDARQTEYSYSADIYSLGQTILQLCPAAQTELGDLLPQMMDPDPKARPTARDILQNNILRRRRNVRLQKIMKDFKQLVQTIKGLGEASTEAKRLRHELTLIIDNVQMAVPNIDTIIALLEEKNQLPPATPFNKHNQLMDLVTVVCNVIEDACKNLKMAETDLSELENKLNGLKIDSLRLGKKNSSTGMKVGGAIAGGAVGTGLMLAPIIGASGAILVAGVAFPPILIVAGAVILFGGLSIGLAAIISEAVQKKNRQVLSQIGQVLNAVAEMKDIQQDLTDSLNRVANVLQSEPVRSPIAATGTAPEVLQEEKEKWTTLQVKLDNVQWDSNIKYQIAAEAPEIGYQNKNEIEMLLMEDYHSTELEDEAIDEKDTDGLSLSNEPLSLGVNGLLCFDEEFEPLQMFDSESLIVDEVHTETTFESNNERKPLIEEISLD